MAARSGWKGFLKLSLVSVPVKAYSVKISGGGDIRFNQLHQPCKSRVQQKKFCPQHGEIKESKEIVSGYEFGKDQYVLIDTDELDKLRTEDDKAIKISTFISPTALDPMYFTDRSSYLVPDGPVGQKSYAVILRGMEEEKRYALGQVVISGKEQLVLLRPLDGVLVMTTLNLDNEISKPGTVKDEVPSMDVNSEELGLVKMLIKGSCTDKLNFGQYKDVYTEKLTQLIDAKVQGKELVIAPSQAPADVMNLMDALKQSVAKVAGTQPAPAAASPAPAAEPAKAPEAAPAAEVVKPPRKMAPMKKPAATPAKKKKQA